MTRGRLVVLAAITAASVTAVPGVAAAAPVAAQAPAGCPANSLCLYEHANFGGRMHRVPGSVRNTGLGGFGDLASSWFNSSGKPFCLIDNSDPHISTILARVLPNTGGNATGGWFGTNDKADFVTDFCPNGS